MGKFRRARILGAGVLTPALTGMPQNAVARSVDVGQSAEICSADVVSGETARASLAALLFSLSPAEKRAIAGDRIRTNMPRTKLAVEVTATCGKAGTLRQKAAGAVSANCGGTQCATSAKSGGVTAHPMVHTPPKVNVPK